MNMITRKGGGIVSMRVLVGIVLLLTFLVVGGIIVNYGGDTAKTVMDEILSLRDIIPSIGEEPGDSSGGDDASGGDTSNGDSSDGGDDGGG